MSTSPATPQSPSPHTKYLWVVLVGTALWRASTACFGPDHFNDDRDAYLVLAQGMADGRGYSVPGTTRPTAYRPPLYPVLLTPVSGTDLAGKAGRAAVHVLLSVGMVWFTWNAAESLGLGLTGKLLTAGLLCFDPLLVLYANFPMTETLCACLGAWLIQRMTTPVTAWRGSLLTGIVFGLCVLSRPTFWVAGGMLVIANGMIAWWQNDPWRLVLRTVFWTSLGVSVCVVPWGVRNWLSLGSPVLMTTHGGYTALLGNNDDFYDQVTARRWSTLWEGEGQERWADRINQELDEQGILNEVERDTWMSAKARETMKRRPELFIRATIARVLQFWNIVPGGDSFREIPSAVVYGVAMFYIVYWTLSLRGLARVISLKQWNWYPLLLLPVAFMCVHAVYWSNIRMRAPILPVVALLAAYGLEWRRKNAAS